MFFTVLEGRIGRNAEVKHFEGGQSVVSFSVAHTDRWKGKDGSQKERTSWVEASVWRKPEGADKVSKYLLKGTHVLLKGRQSSRAYINASTNEAVSVDQIRVEELKFLSRAPQQNNQPDEFTPADEDDLPF